MSIVGRVLSTLLWAYLLVMIARLIFDYIRIFARSWQPKGVVLLLAELVYTLTDPPLRFLRRFIPPLRLGGVSLDLSFLVLIIVLQILLSFARRL
ncbi:MAG: YggT family protein [Actinobacteria bacterium]|nr:YggT family protein [Actinomycetota bacterium]